VAGGIPVVRALRDSLGFEVLAEVTCADYLPRAPRYEVVYHLLSVSKRLRLRLSRSLRQQFPPCSPLRPRSPSHPN